MAGALPVKVEVIRQLVWGPMETLLKGAPNLGHISKIEKKHTINWAKCAVKVEVI